MAHSNGSIRQRFADLAESLSQITAQPFPHEMPHAPTDPTQSTSAASGGAGGAGGVGAPALGMPSLGASIAVHGALFASLIFALPEASSPSETEGSTVDFASVRLDRAQPEDFDDPLETEFELQRSAPKEEYLPLDPEPAILGPDPLDDLFDVLPLEPDYRDPALPDWNVEDLLEDPELQPGPRAAEVPLEPVEPEVILAEAEPVSQAAPADAAAPAPAAVPAPAEAVKPRALPDGCPPPVYPAVAERRGWTGTVVLLIEVAANGTVAAVSVESTSGYSILDDAALRAVRQWRFEPGTLGGKPTALTVRKPIQFGK